MEIDYKDASVKALINMNQYAGFSTWNYCVNDTCKDWERTDRYGCKGYWSKCESKVTIKESYFEDLAKKAEQNRKDHLGQINQGAGI